MLRPRAPLRDQATVVLLAITLAAWVASWVIYAIRVVFWLGARHAARPRPLESPLGERRRVARAGEKNRYRVFVNKVGD
jgi:hypothetical protein